MTVPVGEVQASGAVATTACFVVADSLATTLEHAHALTDSMNVQVRGRVLAVVAYLTGLG